MLNRGRHLVEGPSKQTDFIVPINGNAVRVITSSDFPGSLIEKLDGRKQLMCSNEGRKKSEQDCGSPDGGDVQTKIGSAT